MKTIKFKGIEYPIQFNMLVFREFEQATGWKISQVGELLSKVSQKSSDGTPVYDPSFDDLIKMVTLIYCGVNDGCEEHEKDFPFTLKQFIRGIDLANVGEMFSKIDLGQNEIEGDTENKRQPKKVKVTE